MYRTHTCGELGRQDVGCHAALAGWVASQRDHGGLIFIDLRDRWGITQIVFDPALNREIHETAKKLRMETVIAVRGKVVERPASMVKKALSTGEIELQVSEIEVLNESKPVPLPVKDPCEAMDETRLKYRYLDLRRPKMQSNLILRHRAAQTVRRFFDSEGFIEIETPFLMKSTPEGARDYLVPSRIHKGKFYALPQSPQQYKQLLMIAGFDRYFQIVKCFRDEALRADRQPEFTQIDVEMAFVNEEDVIETMERLVQRIFKEILDITLETPFPRIKYNEAMRQYGNDRPDMRYDLAIVDVTPAAAATRFRVFRETVEQGGVVRGLCLRGHEKLSRKQIDELTDYSKSFGSRGLIVIQNTEEGIQSSISKFLSDEEMTDLVRYFNAGVRDIIFIIADSESVCCDTLGNLRIHLANKYRLYDPRRFMPLWVLDFPLLEWDPEENRYAAMHHPFTSPKPEDLSMLDTEPGKVRARAYDLVLNGAEIAGGSIRNHQSRMQFKMFDLLGIDRETAMKKFGFLLEALDYGAPPHGGIAVGFDRLAALLRAEESIKDVIAFPKTTSAASLMDGCPSEVSDDQLKELGLKIVNPEEEE